MELQQKLAVLADAAKYDASCASSGSKRTATAGGIGNAEGMGICHSYTPDGRCVSLLKVLLTNSCIYDCQYCINRISSDVRRARFTPEELASLMLDFYRRNYIEGLFLSSGVVKSPDYTMEEMVRVARLLREEHGFGGYIHLKVVPGASAELLEKAGRYADRLSANVELPTAADLVKLAPQKKPQEIDGAMQRIALRIEETSVPSRSAQAPKFAPAGQSTQLIVGATDTGDGIILRTASRLYSEHKLRRVYYSAFSPIPAADPRLPLKSPPLVREHRLYQADWLIRHYGFRAEELVEEGASLSLELDPKSAWALRSREFFPVDLNRAPKESLLRVPGLGVRTVKRLLQLRRFEQIRLPHLVKLRVSLTKVRPWIVTADHRPTLLLERETLPAEARREEAQLELFQTAAIARRGEL